MDGKDFKKYFKRKKVYLFNYPVIEDEAARFENIIALELLRAVQMWKDTGYGNFSLHYLRDKNKQEVDFLIAKNNKPFLLIETKLSEDAPSASLINFQDNLDIPAIQLVKKEEVKKFYKNILIITAHRWLSALP